MGASDTSMTRVPERVVRPAWRLRLMLLALALCLFEVGAARAEGGSRPAAALHESPDEWLSYGRDYSEQRFSPLTDIDAQSVPRLGLKWYLDLPAARSLQATPLAVNGVLYFTTSWAVVYAVEARGGKVLWTYDPQVRQVLAKDPRRMIINWGTHRGVAYWNNRIYVATNDGRLVALAADTGKPRWSVQTFDEHTPRFITGAPRAFNGKIIIGHGGGDVGAVRGYVTAYDAETGKQAWRFYTVPGDPASGFENKAMEMAAATWSGDWWKLGGGAVVWNAITYDPDFNRIYIGTGNAAPWNQKLRGTGSNLFAASIVALDADTGEYRWHYQAVPGDTWDYDAATDIILATIDVDGMRRRVLMQAGKNGFFYVIDRATGELLSADPLWHQTWAERVDSVTGKPVEVKGARYESGEALVWPGPGGMHSWQPMSYSPVTKLVYIPVLDAPGYYNDRGLRPGSFETTNFGANFGLNLSDADLPVGAASAALIAWDPAHRREVWRVPQPGAWPAGTLVTQGGLVFAGNAAGKFVAYEAGSGRKLWEFAALRGIVAAPISYRAGGRQCISVLADWSGGAVQNGGSLFAQHGWTYRSEGRRLLTFALDANQVLPKTESARVVPLDVPGYKIDPALQSRGNRLYARNCASCHGAGVISGGAAPDLRASALAADFQTLERVVLKGALLPQGMPKFEALSSEDVAAIYAHIRARARGARP